jgi:hypothetical protein
VTKQAKGMKLLIGLVAILLLGWINHGPLGQGARFINGLDAQARQVIAETELTGIDVRMARQPLARVATLSGPADEFQRYGMGSFKGITQRVADIPGMARVKWSDQADETGFVLPLLVETLLQVTAAYLIGVVLALIVIHRRRAPRYA